MRFPQPHGQARDYSPDRVMKPGIVERRISCPCCGEPGTILLDPSNDSQSYIEDCQVCCQPLQISFDVTEGEPSNLQVDCAT